jgi:hypothetical protein
MLTQQDEILKYLKRIDAKLTNLYRPPNSPTWAKVSWVAELTGWNGEKMRQAREQGLVKWKNDPKKGRLYNLDSISPMFIQKK